MNDRFSWWNNLRHGGLLLDTPRLTTLIPDDPEPLTAFDQDRLRRRLTRFQDDAANIVANLSALFSRQSAASLGRWANGIAGRK